MKNKNINLDHSRPGEHREIMEKIDQDGVCPFCQPNLKKYHQKPILKQNSSWILTTNQYPYKGSRHHFLVINKRHQEDILKLTAQESDDLFKLLQWVTKKYKLPGGGIFMRFGQTDYSGASVTHLHAHLITGGKKNNRNKENYLNAPLGYHV